MTRTERLSTLHKQIAGHYDAITMLQGEIDREIEAEAMQGQSAAKPRTSAAKGRKARATAASPTGTTGDPAGAGPGIDIGDHDSGT